MNQATISKYNLQGKAKIKIIIILGILTAYVPFSVDSYLPAISSIADYFGTSAAHMTFSLTTFFIGFATGQLVYGPLLDRFGRKTPLYYGLIISILASAGCIFAWNEVSFISFRFIQALGAAVASVAALAMVRDFFSPDESPKIFSLLVLIIGSSPLLAPTLGGFITAHAGWHWVFVFLSGMAVMLIAIIRFLLPVKYVPDKDATLNIRQLLINYQTVLLTPQFTTYAFAGAFSFATLFIYVAGSPIIFMEKHGMNTQTFGILFALLSVGFIGASQLNILVLKKYSSAQIFRFALSCQVIIAILFLTGTLYHWYDMNATIVLLFMLLVTIGFTSPNGMALALAPIHKNLGSASALVGTIRIGIAGLSSGGIGLFDSTNSLPVAGMIAFTVLLSLIILTTGSRKMVLKGIAVQMK
ncbi:MAG: Bcr/CflA family efflux MFS transporter [Bacteroidetes bacterium]|jgi:DHA1 family bicyclomycin/chloramphenicol resistance-like MFS transporter|nr:Bcr/CflA family efflux MFS transporter [Bacteroidota bacterium]